LAVQVKKAAPKQNPFSQVTILRAGMHRVLCTSNIFASSWPEEGTDLTPLKLFLSLTTLPVGAQLKKAAPKPPAKPFQKAAQQVSDDTLHRKACGTATCIS
jgi:hypothetical protein